MAESFSATATLINWFRATPSRTGAPGYGRRLLSGLLAQCAMQRSRDVPAHLLSRPPGSLRLHGFLGGRALAGVVASCVGADGPTRPGTTSPTSPTPQVRSRDRALMVGSASTWTWWPWANSRRATPSSGGTFPPPSHDEIRKRRDRFSVMVPQPPCPLGSVSKVRGPGQGGQPVRRASCQHHIEPGHRLGALASRPMSP